jgi:hypothetical protein
MFLKDIETLKSLLLRGEPGFWDLLRDLTQTAQDFDEIFLLTSIRKKAHARQLARPGQGSEKIRLAILGGAAFIRFTNCWSIFAKSRASSLMFG